MRAVTVFIFFLSFVLRLDASERAVIYPDIIPGAKLQILNVPGFRSVDDCRPKCKMAHSISYDQQITATGQKQVRSFKDVDGDTVFEEYIEVETVVDQKLIKGWVPADLTSHQRPDEELTTPETHNAWFSTKPPKLQTAPKNAFRQLCSDVVDWAMPTKKFVPSESDMHSFAKKTKEDAAREKLPLLQTTKIVEQLVGKCAIENPKALAETDLKSPISYDSIVLPQLINDNVAIYKKEKDKAVVVNQGAFLHVRDLNIPNLNAQTLIEIDALSRTIFAEMAGCIPIGPQYAMAVARVIKNREVEVQKLKAADYKKAKDEGREYNPVGGNEFMWEKSAIHWPGKNISTKVATSPVQFSGWNNHIIDSKALKKAREVRRKELIASGVKPGDAAQQARQQVKENPDTLEFYKFNKSGMLHTLCPPRSPDENYYEGRKPYPELLAIWHNTVKIAVEATLYPEQFAKKTESLKDVLHYTSGRSSFYGFCPLKGPVVDGKKLDSNRCLNLWIDPKRSPEYCKKSVEEPAKKTESKKKDAKRSPAKVKLKGTDKKIYR